MAKYKREFLVPYLQDICALYIAEKKIDDKISRTQREIRTVNSNVKYPDKPTKEHYPATSGRNLAVNIIYMLTLGLSITFIFVALSVALVLWLSDELQFLTDPILLVPMSIGVLLFLISRPFRILKRKNDIRDDEAYKKTTEQYKQECKKYELQCIEVEACRAANIDNLNRRINKLDKERNKIQKLRTNAYNVNIIPGQYRNIYAAIYLYDYFSGSQEDDLALALNTFVLEQIKDRLDRIIENQSEMILNQYAIISNQQRAMEQQERHHAELCRKLDHIKTSNEERNTYLSMIESNTATAAYFAAADYIRRI